MSAPRHPATADVWEWLEHGEGRDKPEAVQRAARERVEEIDREFLSWEAETPEIEYPATVLVHWPSGPVPACGMHGQQLVNLGNFLGAHVVASPIVEAAECENCRNEAGAENGHPESDA